MANSKQQRITTSTTMTAMMTVGALPFFVPWAWVSVGVVEDVLLFDEAAVAVVFEEVIVLSDCVAVPVGNVVKKVVVYHDVVSLEVEVVSEDVVGKGGGITVARVWGMLKIGSPLSHLNIEVDTDLDSLTSSISIWESLGCSVFLSGSDGP